MPLPPVLQLDLSGCGPAGTGHRIVHFSLNDSQKQTNSSSTGLRVPKTALQYQVIISQHELYIDSTLDSYNPHIHNMY